VKSALLVKVVFVSVIIVLLALGLTQIQYLVNERMQRRDGVVQEIAASTARAQTITGPLLVVPYTRIVKVQQAAPREGKVVTVEDTKEERLYLTPVELDVKAKIGTERLRRGLHHAFVFRTQASLRGKFVTAGALVSAGPNERIVFGKPRLIVGISDPRGLMRVPVLRWNEQSVELLPGTAEANLSSGIQAPMPQVDASRPWAAEFSLDLELRGTQSFDVVPVGDATRIELAGSWPHPSFYGQFLPEKRDVRDDGFSATWSTTRLATDIQNRLNTELEHGGAREPGIGVRFVDPGDQYAQTDRSIKYGLLFIGLTFAAFFLFEVLKRLTIHPLQYGLTGAALVLFYLLLLALSEHLAFGLAYAIGAGACVALLTFYVVHVLGSLGRGLGFGLLLACVFGVLYVLISLEDHALLAGSLSLFGALAVVMIVTRKVDWYRLTAPTSVPAPS
jgi:inner membrane protein